MTKYAVISSGIVYAYFDKIEDAEDFITNQTQIHTTSSIPTQSYKIVKVEKVYKLTKIDENQKESLYGFKETTSGDDSDYDTMFDNMNIYGDGYDW